MLSIFSVELRHAVTIQLGGGVVEGKGDEDVCVCNLSSGAGALTYYMISITQRLLKAKDPPTTN